MRKPYITTGTKRYLVSQKKSLLGLGALLLVNIGFQTLAPEILGRFIDAAESGGLFQTVLLMIGFYFLTVLLQTAVASLANYQTQALGCRVTDAYRRDVMAHYLDIGMDRHNRIRSGDILTRLDEDTQGLFKYWNILIFKLGASGLLLLCVLAVLLLRDGLLAAVLLAVSLLAILGFKWIQDRGVPKYVRSAKASAEFNGSMKELVDNAVEIRSFDAAPYAEARLKTAMRQRYRESFPASLMYGNLWSAATMMQAAVQICALGFGIFLWDAGQITAGTVFMMYTYTDLIIGPLQDFRNHMGSLQEARAGMLRMKELMETPISVTGGSKKLEGDTVSMEIRGLSFGYTDQREVLHNVSLRLETGQKLGIMGKTGCGKSTLLGLIARLYDYGEGEILLNSIEIRDLDLKSLRDRVAYCPQTIQLLHGTIRENVTLFDTRFTDEAIWDAITALNLRDWVSKYPDGLDTMLDMGDNSLSAGEAQLITLIRLALRNPKLILLDEITSRLDSATELKILSALEALCRGRTVLAISHKLSAVAWMDEVLRMDDGVLCDDQTEVL